MTRTITNDESTLPGDKLANLGAAVLRYGLAAVLVWVGLLKFTAYEAEGIQGLVAHSPLFSWAYGVMSVRAFAALLGVIEITLGLLIALRRVSPRLSAFGSIGATIMFLLTLTFLLTTPGIWQPAYGFPFLSPMPGQFVAKDLLFLGAALWSAGEALRATGPSGFDASRTT
ncbi:MAG: DUF417 family protein [Chthoniobacterales bacterium]|nr:DUF417 family protein [Chthoniobacterales bacterium]